MDMKKEQEQETENYRCFKKFLNPCHTHGYSVLLTYLTIFSITLVACEFHIHSFLANRALSGRTRN